MPAIPHPQATVARISISGTCFVLDKFTHKTTLAHLRWAGTGEVTIPERIKHTEIHALGDADLADLARALGVDAEIPSLGPGTPKYVFVRSLVNRASR